MSDNGHDYGLDLGPCCACQRAASTKVVMLEILSPTPGHGWGCIDCGLPPNGAIAVVCDDCFRDQRRLLYVCTGFPGTEGRTHWSAMKQEAFLHDQSKHAPEDFEDGGVHPRVLILADAYFAALMEANQRFVQSGGNETVSPEEMSAALGAVLTRLAHAMEPDHRAYWVATWVKTLREAAGIQLQ